MLMSFSTTFALFLSDFAKLEAVKVKCIQDYKKDTLPHIVLCNSGISM